MTNTEATIHDEFAHLQDDWESASRYLSLFIDESRETLDELTEALLALEAGGGRENIKQLFIAAHRIKGSAASIGLNRAAKLAHLMEDLLQILVDDDRELEPNAADCLLACTDGLRLYLNALGAGRPEEDHFALLAEQLLDARKVCDTVLRPSGAKVQPEALPPASEGFSGCSQPALELGNRHPERSEGSGVNSEEILRCAQDDQRESTEAILGHALSRDLRRRVVAVISEEEYDRVLVGQVFFEPNLPLVGLKAQLVYSKLSNLGNIRYVDPPLADIENRETLDSLCFGIATETPREAVQRYLQVAGVQQIIVEPFERRPPRKTTVVSGLANASELGAKPAETLRVDVERLDRLMNLAGQLAIGKARVAQIGEKLKNVVTGEKAVQIVNNLFETIHLLDSVSNGIRQNVMDMRMLPIGPLLNRFHRVIRDITHANGKDVRLAISGEKTELDKRMIDELGDPMIHLIRNAADHGIEAPELRAAAGKPRQGTVSLDAFHRGSNIIIRITDDGQGLDADRIRAKAVEKGLVAAADAELMTPQQIYQLIWLPGLSTAEKVTDVSGRGMGMDIVRAKIKDLNGAVDVASEPGRGTTFTVRLPLTLAVLPSLMVENDGDVFALPMESVVEIVRVDRHEMTTVHGHWTVPLRGRVVGVSRLDALFNWRRRNDGPKSSPHTPCADRPDEQRAAGTQCPHTECADYFGESGKTMLVIIGEGNRQLGLAVDRVLGEEDVVIKSIGDNYRNVNGIAGASILGDGRVSLILDPPTLIEMASRPVAATGIT